MELFFLIAGILGTFLMLLFLLSYTFNKSSSTSSETNMSEKTKSLDKRIEFLDYKLYFYKNNLPKLQEKLHNRFYDYLVFLCAKENIKLIFFESIEDLNSYFGYNKKRASGVIRRINNRFIIFLVKNYYVWTFAHEVGHYYSIIKNNDITEKSADAYIMTLAKQIFSNEELSILRISLEIHSNKNIGIENHERLFNLTIAKEYLKEKGITKIQKKELELLLSI